MRLRQQRSEAGDKCRGGVEESQRAVRPSWIALLQCTGLSREVRSEPQVSCHEQGWSCCSQARPWPALRCSRCCTVRWRACGLHGGRPCATSWTATRCPTSRRPSCRSAPNVERLYFDVLVFAARCAGSLQLAVVMWGLRLPRERQKARALHLRFRMGKITCESQSRSSWYGCMQAKVAARVHACADVLAPVAASITALAVRRLSGNPPKMPREAAVS